MPSPHLCSANTTSDLVRTLLSPKSDTASPDGLYAAKPTTWRGENASRSSRVGKLLHKAQGMHISGHRWGMLAVMCKGKRRGSGGSLSRPEHISKWVSVCCGRPSWPRSLPFLQRYLPGKMSVDDLIHEMDLKAFKGRETSCYGISAKEATNLDAVLQWLIARKK